MSVWRLWNGTGARLISWIRPVTLTLLEICLEPCAWQTPPVSYTHLDVYKRQLEDEDELISVQLTGGSEEIIIGTDEGYFIRFPESDVRPMGRVARGVKAVTLRPPHRVIGADLIRACLLYTSMLPWR